MLGLLRERFLVFGEGSKKHGVAMVVKVEKEKEKLECEDCTISKEVGRIIIIRNVITRARVIGAYSPYSLYSSDIREAFNKGFSIELNAVNDDKCFTGVDLCAGYEKYLCFGETNKFHSIMMPTNYKLLVYFEFTHNLNIMETEST